MSLNIICTCIRYVSLNSIVRPPLHNLKDLCNSLSRCRSNNQKYTFIDVIDSFVADSKTAKKIHEKVTMSTSTMKQLVGPPLPLYNFEQSVKMSTDPIDESFSDALKDSDLNRIQELLLYCVEHNVFPSSESLDRIFCKYADNSNIQMITALQKYCKSSFPEVFRENCGFQIYSAKAFWKRGNIEEACKLFLKMFDSNVEKNIKFKMRDMYEKLICEAVDNGSEASLVIIEDNVKRFYNLHHEVYPLYYFWRYCWRSEWFKDQQLAESLFDEFNRLRNILSDRVGYDTFIALKNDEEDAVLRLLQTLLRHKMRYEYDCSIKMLFDYRLKRSDVSGCAEIINNCSILNIKLSAFQNERYLMMIISRGKQKPYEKKKIVVKDFKIKF